MEVTVEYEQTPLGTVPEDWDVKLLRDVAEIRSGVAKNSKISVDDPVLVHYLRVANVQDGFLDLSNISKIEISRRDLKRYAVLPGDVLMNEGGDLDKLGRGSIWLGEFDPCIHQNHVFVVRCGPRLIPQYLTIWTGSTTSRRYFLVAGKQTTNLASISKTSLGDLPVLTPPRPEQRAIATALGDVDALLGALERLITKKRDLKQAAMQQLLTGKTRLPGFSGEWEVKRVGDVAPLQRGFDLPNRLLRDGPFPVVYSNGVLSHHEAFRVTGPGVVTGRSGTIGTVTFVENNYWPHNTSLWVTSFGNNFPKFIFYLYTRLNLGRFASGSGVPTLNRNDVHSLDISIPTKMAEQIAITEVLTDMDAELAAAERRLAKTRALKQAMMQELLTGRTRLIPLQEAHA